mmetsp:Transcript_22323/g.34675  ORF Transcript_22323/g.34675 Transcript_22323/m.34675 type:complete len:309 (-) Transcript_22323:428-1354(-)
MSSSALQADCFYFLQGSCTKGTACNYRHSPAALGNHTVCKFWLSNSCTNAACSFRHPAIPGHGVAAAPPSKDRSQTPCYWETQPTGCAKDDCPFLHINKKTTTEEKGEGEAEAVSENGEGKEGEESLEELEELEGEGQGENGATEVTVEKAEPPKIEKPRKIIEVKTRASRFGVAQNKDSAPPSQPAKFGVKSFQDILAQREGGAPTTTTPPQLKRRREETTNVQVEQPKKIPKLMAETESVPENQESNGAAAEEVGGEEEIVAAANTAEASALGVSTDDLGLLDGDLDIDEDVDLDDDDLRKELLDL